MIRFKTDTRKSKRLGISGKGGCGKSTAITKIHKKPIVLDLEEKWPVPAIPTADLGGKTSYIGVKNTLLSLLKEQSLKEYDGVWIDTVSELEQLSEFHAIEKDYQGNKGKYAAFYSGDNNQLPQYFSEILNVLSDIQKKHDIDVGLVIHTTEGNETNPIGPDYYKIKLDLKKKIYAKVLKWFDFLGCVYDENDIDDSALKAKATGSKRMISFDNTSPFYDAKSLGTGEKVFEFDPNGAWYKKLRRE